MGGIQWYAYGQHDGKWLIIGGRLDGLHRRQPFASNFDMAGHNNQLIVIDPVARQKWSAPLTSLPVGMQEQLSATNMEFIQEGDFLYLVGGYGYSNTAGDHITYKLTAVKVSEVITAIINETPSWGIFVRLRMLNLKLPVGISKIFDTYYLVGGQKFEGRYNPMGPTHGPGFSQAYTDQIRKFKINDDGNTLAVSHLSSFTDTVSCTAEITTLHHKLCPTGKRAPLLFRAFFKERLICPTSTV